MHRHYSMLIQWSGEDQAYVVTLPEFPLSHTHGLTYEEAVKNRQEVLDLLIEAYATEDKLLPEPVGFQYAVA